MTNEEFKNWVIYVRDYPLDVQEYQMAVIAYIVSKQGGSKDVELEDFMVSGKKPKAEEPQLSGEALGKYLEGMFG